jgi:formiminoglutamase
MVYLVMKHVLWQGIPGMSDQLMSIGFYDYNPELDKSDVTAKQLAQMVWYFMEGVSLSRNDYPIVDEKDFNMLHCTD